MSRFLSCNRFAITLAIGVTLIAVSLAAACKVPVFRYALERWPADTYRIVAVVDSTKTNSETQAAIKYLEDSAASGWNAEVDVIRLDRLSEAELWELEEFESEDSVPLLQVFYPERDGKRQLCSAMDLTIANAKTWRSSPLRTQIANDIQAGVSAVWLLVEGDDAAQNERLFGELRGSLDLAQQQITIPEGVIGREEATQVLMENPEASMDDVLRSDIPLKIEYSVHRLAVDNDDETALRAMIQNWENEQQAPFVVPIFGRGRMLQPLSADRVQKEMVLGACRYLVGECTCSVKALSPGMDLLLSTNWKEAVGETDLLIADESAIGEPVEIPQGAETRDSAEQKESEPSVKELQTGTRLNEIYFSLAIVLSVLGFAFVVRRVLA